MLTTFFTGLGLSQRLARFAGPVIGLLLVLALVGGLWARLGQVRDQRDDARADLRAAEAAIAVLRTDADLKEAAAVRRGEDQTSTARTEEELNDAIEEVLDSAPDAKRVRLGCERLRRAAATGAALPAICGSGG